MINDESIQRNNIEIPKNRRRYIPISWFLTETPKSEIRLKLSQDGESYLVFYHISEIMSDPISKKKKDENLKKKIKNLKKYEHTKNLEKKDLIEKIKNDSENLLNSKIINIKNEEISEKEIDINKNKYLCFDYYIYQSKGVSQLISSEEYYDSDFNRSNSYKRTNTNSTEKINLNNTEFEFSYEYFVYVRPCMTFINLLPFNLNISINDYIKIQLDKNTTENIYDINPQNLNNNHFSLKIILDY